MHRRSSIGLAVTRRNAVRSGGSRRDQRRHTVEKVKTDLADGGTVAGARCVLVGDAGMTSRGQPPPLALATGKYIRASRCAPATR